jgi:hypothetical protein
MCSHLPSPVKKTCNEDLGLDSSMMLINCFVTLAHCTAEVLGKMLHGGQRFSLILVLSDASMAVLSSSLTVAGTSWVVLFASAGAFRAKRRLCWRRAAPFDFLVARLLVVVLLSLSAQCTSRLKQQELQHQQDQRCRCQQLGQRQCQVQEGHQ